jgi:hypothetical protein
MYHQRQIIFGCILILLTANFRVIASNTTTKPSIKDEYSRLLKDVVAYNDGRSGEISGWLMSPEHLFLGIDDPLSPQSLQHRVIRFSRLPGGLDLLFGRIIDRKTDDDEILAVAEILVFYAQQHEPGDEKIMSTLGNDVRNAVKSGRLVNTEKKFPEASIRDPIVWAVEKSDKNLAKSSTRPTTAPQPYSTSTSRF